MEEETGDIKSILYHGRGEPGASVHVHMPGILAQWVGVDGARKLEYSDRKGIPKRSSP